MSSILSCHSIISLSLEFALFALSERYFKVANSCCCTSSLYERVHLAFIVSILPFEAL